MNKLFKGLVVTALIVAVIAIFLPRGTRISKESVREEAKEAVAEATKGITDSLEAEIEFLSTQLARAESTGTAAIEKADGIQANLSYLAQKEVEKKFDQKLASEIEKMVDQKLAKIRLPEPKEEKVVMTVTEPKEEVEEEVEKVRPPGKAGEGVEVTVSFEDPQDIAGYWGDMTEWKNVASSNSSYVLPDGKYLINAQTKSGRFATGWIGKRDNIVRQFAIKINGIELTEVENTPNGPNLVFWIENGEVLVKEPK